MLIGMGVAYLKVIMNKRLINGVYYYYYYYYLELSIDRINSIQDSLIRVLLRLLVTHTDLCYYQGLHDVVLTFLLLPLNVDTTFAIMNVLVQYHIR